MKQKLLFIFFLMLMAVPGAWAEGKVRISVANVYGGDENKLGSGCKVYFLTTEMASTDSWAKQPSFEAFQNALKDKYSKGLTSNGALSNTVVNNSDLGLTDEASVTCYLLILNSSEIAEGVRYYITPTTNITTSAFSMVSAAFGNQATNSQNPANWHEVGSFMVTAKDGGDDNYWATFYNDSQGYTADENTKVFQAALSGSSLALSEVAGREIPAGQGVILKSTAESITLSPATTSAILTGNQLVGTTTSITTPPSNAYVLNKGTNGVGFYKISATGTIGAYKAYLTYSSSANTFEFFPFDVITGIEMPTADVGNADAVVYDLQGRRVAQPTKGLYIVNGKKVFINK